MIRAPNTPSRGRSKGEPFARSCVVAESGTTVVVWYWTDADQEDSIVVDFGVKDNDIFDSNGYRGSATGVNDDDEFKEEIET